MRGILSEKEHVSWVPGHTKENVEIRHLTKHSVGMGWAVVPDLLSELQKDNAYHVTFDNLFTSLALVDTLSKMGIACTGTIRCNMVENCPLKPVAAMLKTNRGSYDYAYGANNQLIVVRWNDNNIVNVVSNQFGVQSLQNAGRWSRQEGQRLRIPQPFVVNPYNQTMGGVDRMDQNIDKYRIGIRSKKWWRAIFATASTCAYSRHGIVKLSPFGSIWLIGDKTDSLV